MIHDADPKQVMLMSLIVRYGIMFVRHCRITYCIMLNVSGKNPSPMWDRLVFNKIKARLGGRVRFMASGASPLSPDVMDFLKM